MKPPFIVYGLPRSRTFWLSRWLSYGDWECWHDELRHARSLEDVKAWFSQPNIGTVETAGAPWWRLVQKMRPDIRTVVVRRPVNDVIASLMGTGLRFNVSGMAAYLRRLDMKLDQIEARIPSVLRVEYESLRTEASCAALFEHCLPYQHDTRWWDAMGSLNLQTNIGVTLRYYQAYAPQLEKLAKIAKHSVLSWLLPRTLPDDGIVIQEERFDTFYRDGKALFSEHLVMVGEEPDGYLHKNISLMRHLDASGGLQTITARCNGRMFGYLMTSISQSLEEEGLLSGIQGTFYASPDVPGLGLRLQRASLAALREKGIGEAFLRAGVRGDGPRMGAVYRRIGAEDFGQLYRVNLRDVN
jgi:hypothetical protein